jgi:UDP-N-acetylmuramoyl-L-alanyl-D-glutamate--2,6-diaminopimelate ligase
MQRAHGNGCDFLVMEVSSQALKYGRTAGLEFEVGILLNIGSDHISEIEHPDEEDYVSSKLLIAKQSKVLLFNGNMDGAKKFLQRLKGEERNIKLFRNGDNEIDIALPGDFNQANAEAAIAAAELLGISRSVSEAAIKEVKVPGRMEVFPLGDGRLAIVDYAHNKMSFDALFAAVKRDYPDAQKTIIFGAPGGKAFNRRVELAESSAKNADRVYLVEEDANYEPPEEIAREIEANVRRFAGERPVETKVIVDRKTAIFDAIKTSAPAGVIIIAAKGRETTLKREGKFVPYPTDVEIVEEYMSGEQFPLT